MSGLLLSLAANESILVNGAVVENGDRPARIRIRTADARVLRCADIIHPGEVNTPAKRIYYALQLVIIGDLTTERVMPAIKAECEGLADAFQTIHAGFIPVLVSMIDRGNYYSAMNHLRAIMIVEAELLSRAPLAGATEAPSKVA